MSLDVVLCGVGRRGLEHIDLLADLPELRLRGVHDQSPERASAGAARAGVPGSTDLAALLDRVQPGLVVLATPPRLRYTMVEQIVRHDSVRALIVEKPLALSLDEGDRILEACHAHGVLPVVFHQLRFCPEFVRLKSAIDGGELGELRELHASCFGTLFDQGSHLLDLVCWLLPERQPSWVSAHGVHDLVSLARCTDIPAGFVADTMHPGAPWTQARIGFAADVQLTLSCGVLAPRPEPRLGPWLQKRVVAVGTHGTAEAHAVSHFRLLAGGNGAAHALTSDLAAYRAAQQALYRDVCRTLAEQAGSDPLPDGSLRGTLELLAATLHSERSGQVVRLPFVPLPQHTVEPQPPRPTPRSRPRVSVVIPMEDHRGVGLQAIHAWVEEQRCDPLDYELLVMTSERMQATEAALRHLLRPQDRVVRCGGSDMDQYATGARLARGDILFFTEAHCLPEPETIAQTIDYLDTHDVDGFCARTVPLCLNAVGRATSSQFERGFETWSAPESWVKVIVRGVAIRRATYVTVGGFEARYDRFAEWLLSARLRRGGYQMTYAPGVGIRHVYGESFTLIKDEIRRFTEGECRFRLETDTPEFVREFFGTPAEWSAARTLRFRPLDLIAATIRQRAADAAGPRWTHWQQQAAVFSQRVWAAQRLMATYQLATWSAQARFRLSLTDAQRLRAFQDFYVAQTALCRVRFALRLPPESPRRTRLTTLEYHLPAIDDLDMFGFHTVEPSGGCLFRWSAPIAALKLALPTGSYRVCLQLLAARPLEPSLNVVAFLNTTRLAEATLSPTTWQIGFDIPSTALEGAAEQWLILHVDRWQHPDLLASDPRKLGLPIVSVHFQPA